MPEPVPSSLAEALATLQGRRNVARRWDLDLVPFKPYVYRGTGYDIYSGEEDDDARASDR